MDKKVVNIRNMVASIEGWLTDREGEALYDQAKKCRGDGVIVEIGSWKGKSTIWLGMGSQEGKQIDVYAIDPHTGSSEHKAKYGFVWTFEEFRNNIKNADINHIVKPIVKESEEASTGFNKPIEFIFIDGAHEYESVKLDYQLWIPFVIDGGIIALHDMLDLTSGPGRVIKEFIIRSRNFKNLRIVDSILFAQKVPENSLLDKLHNRYILLLIEQTFLWGRKSLPRPIKKLLRILRLLLMKMDMIRAWNFGTEKGPR